ncbi:B12-binding domain-containing radical SAM protein [Elusimicrobiota bacterium]
MKVLLIQSPRRYWPFLSEGDNYILPMWMPCIAAALRNSGHDVTCIDCMASKTGWKKLETIISEHQPDAVGISESHALYINESLKLAGLVKQVDPGIITICGGGHFSNTSKEILQNPDIDFIVKGEGEITVTRLLDALQSGRDPVSVKGIAFMNDGTYLQTSPRALIEDLDDLPIPAYDLMPMDKYGTSKYLFSPGGITVSHSRGCSSSCSFCVWWVQMADRRLQDGTEKLYPRWRTKSVKRTVDEIEYLADNYKRKCFIFVDGSWNISSTWNEEFAAEIKKRGLDINWFAFMRVDCILRDIENGIMDRLVESGLAHICIGAEHSAAHIMDDLNKDAQDWQITESCLRSLKKKYPGLFVQATFIVGTKKESRETLQHLAENVRKLKVDYPAFHAFTPVPGTLMYETALKNNWLEIQDYEYYDWNTPVISTDELSREDMQYCLYELYRKSVSVMWLLKGLFSRSRYKRNMYIWWLIVTFRVIISSLKDMIKPMKHSARLIEPKWYNS